MAGVTVQFSGDASKLEREITKLQAKAQELEAKLRGVGAAGQKAGDDGSSGFSKIVNTGTVATATIGAVTMGVGVLSKALVEMREQADAAGKSLESAFSGRGYLAQLSSNAENFAKLTSEVERLRKGFGLSTERSQGLVAKASSAGGEFMQQSSLDTLAKLPQIGWDPLTAIDASQKMQSAFGGRAGNMRTILNAILAASGPSPVGSEDIAKAASTASTSWAGIGGSMESLLATGGVFSKAFKSPEAAFERIKSLSDSFSRNADKIVRFDAPGAQPWMAPFPEPGKGLDLIRNLPELERTGRLVAGGKRISARDFLGDSLAVQGYRQILAQSPEILARAGEVGGAMGATGSDTELLSKRFSIAAADPKLQAVLQAQRGAEKLGVAGENRFGTTENLADALESELKADLINSKRGAVSRWINNRVIDAGRFWGNDSFLETFGQFSKDPELHGAIGKAFPGAVRSTATGSEMATAQPFGSEKAGGGGVDAAGAMKALQGLDIRGFNEAVATMSSVMSRLRGGPTLVPANEDK